MREMKNIPIFPKVIICMILNEDGVFYDGEYGSVVYKICFNKDECFQYAAELSEEAEEADWQTP